MRRSVVFALDPGREARVELVYGRDRFEVEAVEELAPQRAVIALDLSLRRPVVGAREEEPDRELGAGDLRLLAAKAPVVVGQDRVRHPAPLDRASEHRQEGLLGLREEGLRVDDHSAPIAEEREDLHPHLLSRSRAEELGSVDCVDLPQLVAARRAPAIARRSVQLDLRPREPSAPEQPLDRGHVDLAWAKQAL
ncbi:MAG: hypothetical protein JKY65_11365 [Planctomycetes bacterium]|nr:hypothetical protein [Planctomycetota bacterium]